MLDFGLSQQEFRASFFEQQIYVRKAAMSERPMQWSDLDMLLYAIEPDASSIQLFAEEQVASNFYIDEVVELGRRRPRLNKQRFYALMQRGATLVLNRIESHSIAAKRLCAEVGRFTGCPTTSNAYVSFGGTGTFGKHWDTHDVFVVQLIGKKHWRLYAPTFPLPLSYHTSKQMRHECPSRPVMEVVLTAGDMLYLPRGWWHEVTPLEEGSLHLSIGSYAPSLCDYIIWACGRQLAQHPAARRGITHDGDELHDAAELMQLAQLAVLSTASLHEFFKDMQARECLGNEFNTALFLSKGAIHQLSDSARLSLTSCYESNSEEVRINGGRMKLEPVSSAIVQQLRNHTTLKLSALCAHLFPAPRHSIVNALMELALYEVVSIIDD